jgi:TetR/AcrR family transcriptional regulator, ethionamide resistance regulator
MASRRTRSSSHGDERRAALLEAFAELLEEQSFAEVGIEEISTRAGLSRSSFYFYFPNKAMAVGALVSDMIQEAHDSSGRWLEDPGSDPYERVLPAIEAAVNRHREHAALYVALADAAATDPTIAAHLHDAEEKTGATVAAQLRAERAAGIATDGPDAKPYVRALIGMNSRALQDEARKVVETGRGTPGLAKVLTEIWVRAFYGNAK